MTVESEDQLRDRRRFERWARRIRLTGHVLRRITYHPESMGDAVPQRVVMVANHRSLADLFVAVEALGHYGLPARCLVRAKYFDAPVMGKWLHSLGCIPAGDGKRESIATAKETLDSGRPVAVMIEGRIIPPDRRQPDGLGEIRPGFVEIARAANAPILPIALVHTDEIWASRGKLPRIPWRGRPMIEVHTGTLVEVGTRTDDEVIAETRQVIAGYLAGA
ncbi:MAG: lysophospholipid acyltransferase family protein [Acidimicrobiales bacterium]